MISALLEAISRGILKLNTADGSQRWALAVKLAVNYVGRSATSLDTAMVSESESAGIIDKWRNLVKGRKLEHR